MQSNRKWSVGNPRFFNQRYKWCPVPTLASLRCAAPSPFRWSTLRNSIAASPQQAHRFPYAAKVSRFNAALCFLAHVRCTARTRSWFFARHRSVAARHESGCAFRQRRTVSFAGVTNLYPGTQYRSGPGRSGRARHRPLGPPMSPLPVAGRIGQRASGPTGEPPHRTPTRVCS